MAVVGSNSWYMLSTVPVGERAPFPAVVLGPNGFSTLPGFGRPFVRVGPKFASHPPEVPSAVGAVGLPQSGLLPAVHSGRGAPAIRLFVIVVWRNCSKLKKKNVLSLPLYTFGILTGPPSVNP